MKKNPLIVLWMSCLLQGTSVFADLLTLKGGHQFDQV
jgi:hypothetical protein